MALSFVFGFSVLWVSLLLLLSRKVDSEPTADKQALLDFLSGMLHVNRPQWNQSVSVCNWVGVQCDNKRSYVYSLRLPGVGLVGPIPSNTLGRLTQLRVLSLRSNRLSGELPSDFFQLKLLRRIYLQNNLFSGEFLSNLTLLTQLTRLDLSFNNFTGEIPFSVNNLTQLTGLFLQNNGFSGNLPSIRPLRLVDFNVSNNNLKGSIPETLSKFPVASFTGNVNLCGAPLKRCNPISPSPSPSPSPSSNPQETQPRKISRNLCKATIIAISVGGVLILLLLLLILLIWLWSRHRRQAAKHPKQGDRSVVAEADTSFPKDDIAGGSAESKRNKLVFFNGGVHNFDLEDLLRASAEVLGKGSMGTSYKAVLEEGTTLVVKRLKDVAVMKKEFESQMEVVGKVKHYNVVPLRAFYYSKDEKLIVYDFMPNGSLSSLLHGSRGSGRTPLDWDHRMNIALSAGRGLAHLHVSSKMVHGNVKSSNMLLKSDLDVAVSDFGLNPLYGTSTQPNRVAGYHAPEVVETRKVSFKSDVYSFGVLLLELLTGKAPNQASAGEEGIDLPRWVQSVVREEWTAEVFDVELMRYNNIEEEMVQLLQIAMACLSKMPDQRPDIRQVVLLMEDINRPHTDDGLHRSPDENLEGI